MSRDKVSVKMSQKYVSDLQGILRSESKVLVRVPLWIDDSRRARLLVANYIGSVRKTRQSADLTAAFVFYGPPPDKDAMERIKAPVYGFFAGNDARIGAMIPDAIANMKAAGKTFEPVTYDGAGHGFMRAGEAPDAKNADKKARSEAWERWKSLMAKG